ncbi:amino acid--tRNA ligase-related protein [Pseudomonas sp. CAM1A]|uniref:amino acid--tRNA ligase-related protein n=1 Tax=Pseudomonas sp. CAM1A TaxID=3231717 RepID=UPI0039C5EC80
MSPDTHPVLYKALMLRRIRQMLDSAGYLEIMTPILRRYPGDADRPRLQLSDGRWLRESSAFALRCNLQYAPAVYELAACFRPDALDATHLPEFTMLDLYRQDASLGEMLDLACRLVQAFYPGPIQVLSFASHLRDDLGIDLFADPTAGDALVRTFRQLYDEPDISPLWLIDRYITEQIEPLSRGCCMVVTDFPLLPEVRARRRDGAGAIVERFEILIDCVEVVHGYTDEDDPDRFEAQARHLASFGPEDAIMCALMRDGSVPLRSAGFGVGIERLCRMGLGLDSVEPLRTSLPFTAP